MVPHVLEDPAGVSRQQVHKKCWWPVMRMTNASYLRRHYILNTMTASHPSINNHLLITDSVPTIILIKCLGKKKTLFQCEEHQLKINVRKSTTVFKFKKSMEKKQLQKLIISSHQS
jgi:hypothetical protein